MLGDRMKTQKHKQPISNSGIRTFKRQSGITLIETMISLALSLIVTSAMVVLMANSLGTSTRIIHMSQLTDELRNAMSMMTRDVRRANFSANAIFCYGNSDCGYAGGIAPQAGDIWTNRATVNDPGTCFIFNLDRDWDGSGVNAGDGAGGFRRTLVNVGGRQIGQIEMWTGTAHLTAAQSSTACAAAANGSNWIALTDPSTVNIVDFSVIDDPDLRFQKTVIESETSSFTQRQRQIMLAMEGQLTLEEDKGDVVVSRRIEDVIYVRNDFIL